MSKQRPQDLLQWAIRRSRYLSFTIPALTERVWLIGYGSRDARTGIPSNSITFRGEDKFEGRRKTDRPRTYSLRTLKINKANSQIPCMHLDHYGTLDIKLQFGPAFTDVREASCRYLPGDFGALYFRAEDKLSIHGAHRTYRVCVWAVQLRHMTSMHSMPLRKGPEERHVIAVPASLSSRAG